LSSTKEGRFVLRGTRGKKRRRPRRELRRESGPEKKRESPLTGFLLVLGDREKVLPEVLDVEKKDLCWFDRKGAAFFFSKNAGLTQSGGEKEGRGVA